MTDCKPVPFKIYMFYHPECTMLLSDFLGMTEHNYYTCVAVYDVQQAEELEAAIKENNDRSIVEAIDWFLFKGLCDVF